MHSHRCTDQGIACIHGSSYSLSSDDISLCDASIMPSPTSLKREISPPPARKTNPPINIPSTDSVARAADDARDASIKDPQPTLAAIEAGEAQIRDHLARFSHNLGAASRQTALSIPRLSIPHFQALYQRNRHAKGRHFVVHQHDHPISGSSDCPRMTRLGS